MSYLEDTDLQDHLADLRRSREEFKDPTIRVNMDTYAEFKIIWKALEDAGVNFFDQSVKQALDTAEALDLVHAQKFLNENPQEYQTGRDTGKWGLPVPERPGNVILKYSPGLSAEYLTNVPRTAIHHSPDGHGWGYGGSAAADLALDILNWFVPPDNQTDVKCYRGTSSQFAWYHHHSFKLQLLGGLPKEGGVVSQALIRTWIEGTRALCDDRDRTPAKMKLRLTNLIADYRGEARGLNGLIDDFVDIVSNDVSSSIQSLPELQDQELTRIVLGEKTLAEALADVMLGLD